MNDFKIPEYAKGTLTPRSTELMQMEEEKEKELRKQQMRHDWKIAIFSIVAGAVSGFITSLIFWLLT